MKITIKTGFYNTRRYGKPWIAEVDLESKPPVYRWGEWFGGEGREGELSIEVEPGSVIARGQRDHRNVSKSAPKFGFAHLDGAVEWGLSMLEARNLKRALVFDTSPKHDS